MKRQLPKILEKYLGLKRKITKELILDPNEEDEMGRKRGEGKREYNHKLTLYRHALNEINQNRKIEKTIKAAESGHTKAMMSLYNFYKEDDKELAFNWLKLAVDNKNKKAIEIYKEVKKEEKDFKKKQKPSFYLCFNCRGGGGGVKINSFLRKKREVYIQNQKWKWGHYSVIITKNDYYPLL